MAWEGGDNLLGKNAKFGLEDDIGPLGCTDGLSNAEEPAACQPEWRFFNLDGSSERKLFWTVSLSSAQYPLNFFVQLMKNLLQSSR